MRPAFTCAYLLCHAADVIAGRTALTRRERLSLLGNFSAFAAGSTAAPLVKAAAAAAGKVPEQERKLLSELERIAELFRELPPQEQTLCRQVLSEVCAGLETDISFFDAAGNGIKAFETEQELVDYCVRLGGAPGVFWTRLSELHGAIQNHGELLTIAQDIGTALQLCNIIRGLPEDLARGRCYLPLEDLRRMGLAAQELTHPRNASRLNLVLWSWANKAMERLSRSEQYLCAISESQLCLRTVFCGAVYWCMETLSASLETGNPRIPKTKTGMARARIYFGITEMPAVLVSDVAYIKGFRLRRETLLAGGPPAALSH